MYCVRDSWALAVSILVDNSLGISRSVCCSDSCDSFRRFRYEFQKAHQFRPYPLSAVRDIVRQSIDALAYVHSLELVHTDIKPENICLVSGQARKPGAPASTKIRLIDFGTAEWCAKDGHRNALVSTRQYRAPEVVMGLGWNHVADLWAIGCVVIEMLAGRQIFPTVGPPPTLFFFKFGSNI